MEQIDSYQVLKVLGVLTPAKVAEAMDIVDPGGKQQIRQILRDLKKSGKVWRDEFGRYRLADDPGRRGGVQAKLWEFMCLSYGLVQPWTAGEAAKAAICAPDYAKRYTRYLVEMGWVEAVGKKGKSNTRVYRVAPGREKEAAPHWNRRGEEKKHKGAQAGKPAPPAAGQEERRCMIAKYCGNYPGSCATCKIMAAGLPDLASAGQIIDGMEQITIAISGEVEAIYAYFADLRQALGLPPQAVAGETPALREKDNES